MLPTEIKLTGDGSHTIFNEKSGEHYHSSFGAIQESQHIFIENGINNIRKKNISVFEAGFGTGLNAFLTLIWAAENNIKVNYTGVELFPPEKKITDILNYPELLKTEKTLFTALHECQWEIPCIISPHFTLKKINADITSFSTTENHDIVFYDAFSPEAQPELWTYEIFSGLQKKLNPGGIFVSYCVKGIVKKALRDAGFNVKVLPGPPGKRHMLYAVKEN